MLLGEFSSRIFCSFVFFCNHTRRIKASKSRQLEVLSVAIVGSLPTAGEDRICLAAKANKESGPDTSTSQSLQANSTSTKCSVIGKTLSNDDSCANTHQSWRNKMIRLFLTKQTTTTNKQTKKVSGLGGGGTRSKKQKTSKRPHTTINALLYTRSKSEVPLCFFDDIYLTDFDGVASRAYEK